MKSMVLALGLVLSAAPVLAGGMAAPVVEPEVVAADAASSGSDNWVGILMLLVVAAAVASN